MTPYESEIKTISSSEEVVFDILGNLNNLSKVADNKAVGDKIKDLQYDTDSCSFAVEGFGRVGFRIVEREPFKTIKLEAENTPVPINVWIQLKQVADNDTKMKLTLKAELPAMIKMMLDKKLKDGINAIADFLVVALNK